MFYYKCDLYLESRIIQFLMWTEEHVQIPKRKVRSPEQSCRQCMSSGRKCKWDTQYSPETLESCSEFVAKKSVPKVNAMQNSLFYNIVQCRNLGFVLCTSWTFRSIVQNIWGSSLQQVTWYPSTTAERQWHLSKMFFRIWNLINPRNNKLTVKSQNFFLDFWHFRLIRSTQCSPVFSHIPTQPLLKRIWTKI